MEPRENSIQLITYDQGERIISLLERLCAAVEKTDGIEVVSSFDSTVNQHLPTRSRYERKEYPEVKFNLFYDRYSQRREDEYNEGRYFYPVNGISDKDIEGRADNIIKELEELDFPHSVYDTKYYWDVPETERQNGINVYPIDLWSTMNFGAVISLMSEHAKQLVCDKKLSLLIQCDGEAFAIDEQQWIRKLSETLISHHMKGCKIVLTCADLDFKQNYSKWGVVNKDVSDNINITTLSIDYFQFAYLKQYLKRTGRYDFSEKKPCEYGKYKNRDGEISNAKPAEILLKPPFASEKKMDFICYNGASRPHRIALVSELYRLGLHKNLISLLFRYDDVPTIQKNATLCSYIKNTFFKTDEQKEYFDAMFVKDRTRKSIIIDSDVNDIQEDDRVSPAKHYKETYFSLVSETRFGLTSTTINSAGPPGEYFNRPFFITEKTFKPIAYFHPFVIVGPVGMLQYLRDEGYQTFPEMFDESYDTIEDDKERFNKICEVVNEFCKKPKEEKQQLYNSVRDKLIHNNQRYIDKFDILKKRYTNYYRQIGSHLK